MSSISFGVGNVIPFPGKKKPSIHASALQKIDRKAFLDIVHSSHSIMITADDQAARSYAIRFCILGLVQIEEKLDDGSFCILKPSEAFQNNKGLPWRVAKRSDAGKVSLAQKAEPAQAIVG